MIKKMIFAAVVCFGSMAITQSDSNADGCYYGRRGYTPRYSYSYRPPVRPYAYGAYRAPIYAPVPVYRTYPSYRYGYGRPGVSVGYSSFGPYRRGGVSIGIGF